MPFIPMAPPQPVAVHSGFDYVTVDAQRRRVYAAHTGSGALLIVNADDSMVLGQVETGTLHGVAVNPQTGHVYTGDGVDRTVSEVDPVAQKVVASVDVDGPPDAIAYDPVLQRIYADEDDGTRMFVIDAKNMKLSATVQLPGHKPEYLAIDPATHKVYQNIANLSEFVVIDPSTLHIVQTVKTPELTNNHPLQIDPQRKHIYVGGANGTMSTYDMAGNKLWETKFDGRFDQCSLDTQRHTLFCAGNGGVTAFYDSGSNLSIVGKVDIDRGVHTVGVDEKTGSFWTVWASKAGDFIQGFLLKR